MSMIGTAEPSGVMSSKHITRIPGNGTGYQKRRKKKIYTHMYALNSEPKRRIL